MRILSGLWFFYQKLIIPSLAVSLLLSGFSMGYVDLWLGVGISYVFLTALFHYYTYEVKNPNEYYFYHNLGLSKLALWANTIIVGVIVGFILSIV